MENLAKAIIAVMKEVKGIEKSMVVGSGSMSYKGVPDQEVKKIIGEAMERNGLCILPIGVNAKTQIDRWEETSQYGNKIKQSVFTEATTRYLLLHTSGESQILEGYGQGVDSQDKSAGKATTYALKYTLLYTFLVPTGKIDDADNTHSEQIETPQRKSTPTPPKEQPQLPWLNKNTPEWDNAVKALKGELQDKDGNFKKFTLKQLRTKYAISREMAKDLQIEAGIEAIES